MNCPFTVKNPDDSTPAELSGLQTVIDVNTERCRSRYPGTMILNLAAQEVEIFGSVPLVGPRVLGSYRRADSSLDIEKINGIGNWLLRGVEFCEV